MKPQLYLHLIYFEILFDVPFINENMRSAAVFDPGNEK